MSNRQAELSKIGRKSAARAITFHSLGFTPPVLKRTVKAIGLMKGTKMNYRVFILALCLLNHVLLNYKYCEEVEKKFGLKLSTAFIIRWFKTIGSFKRIYRRTSRFLPEKYSWLNIRLHKRFMAFSMLFDCLTTIFMTTSKTRC